MYSSTFWRGVGLYWVDNHRLGVSVIFVKRKDKFYKCQELSRRTICYKIRFRCGELINMSEDFLDGSLNTEYSTYFRLFKQAIF